VKVFAFAEALAVSLAIYASFYSEIIPLQSEIAFAHAIVAAGNNSTGRWICTAVISLQAVIAVFMKNPTYVLETFYLYFILSYIRTTQNAPGGKVNVLGGHSIGHSKQKSVNVHVPYSERFPR
jgi:hypothetical protein